MAVELKLHKAETGEQYADKSGWEKRVMVDLQKGELEIELSGGHLSGHPRDIDWLIKALTKVRDAVGCYPVEP